jgi:hypothetical protein
VRKLSPIAEKSGYLMGELGVSTDGGRTWHAPDIHAEEAGFVELLPACDVLKKLVDAK